jgi:hypothetical protein
MSLTDNVVTVTSRNQYNTIYLQYTTYHYKMAATTAVGAVGKKVVSATWDDTQCDFWRTNVSGERSSSILRVTRVGELPSH